MKTSKLEEILPVLAFTSAQIAACEDFTAGDPASDVIRLSDHGRIMFIIAKLAGAAMTVTPTVESCDDVVPTTATAIPYRYRVMATNGTWGEVLSATAAGVLLAAGANQMMAIEVDAAALVDGDEFVRLQLTETDSTAQDGLVIALLLDPRYEESTPPASFLA